MITVLAEIVATASMTTGVLAAIALAYFAGRAAISQGPR
jgi:hypothetical protein